MAAKNVVLFPGAAQQSITWLPGGGLKTTAGRQLACKESNRYDPKSTVDQCKETQSCCLSL